VNILLLLVLFAELALTSVNLPLGQASGGASSAKAMVTISPSKVTLYGGETQAFLATVVGLEDKTVNWTVDENDGGTITGLGLYTAPKIQGIYHVTATSRGDPSKKAVATVTVLVLCDPPYALPTP
jgi:trimeric autotransporter adhesin